MVHLRYFRAERDRWDHVVLMMPDTGNIPNFLPTAEDYQKLVQEILPEQLKQKISQIDSEQFVPQSDGAKKVHAANESKAAAESNAASATDETTEPPKEDSNTETPADVSMENADSTVATDNAESLNQSTASDQVANSEVQYNKKIIIDLRLLMINNFMIYWFVGLGWGLKTFL